MSLLTDLVTAITALAGLTGKNGHIYKNAEVSGNVLITVKNSLPLIKGIDKSAIERPFNLHLICDTQAHQDTFMALINTAINTAITDGYWEKLSEDPIYTESRYNLNITGRQVKVE